MGIWYYRVVTKDAEFYPGAFVPPPDPEHKNQALLEELATLRRLKKILIVCKLSNFQLKLSII
ncbi:hypothetical protein NIES2101_13230 [Calothrix sp. HK-06]|nr:hypothetical protein NIES2101_13230 [Calothrix sp. HK-06]